MTLLRALSLITAVAFVTAASVTQAQQKFPHKPVRIVSVGAGSQGDILTRMIAPKLSEAWGQPVVVENRAGAGGTLAANTVAKATPDGYTILLLSSQFAIGAAMHARLPYDPVKDFAGISQVGSGTVTLLVHPSLGVKSVKEFIALAHAKPGQIVFSSAGAGSGSHLNGEMFRHAAGIKAVHVGFKSSSEATIEVVAGRIHYGVLPLGPALHFIKDGKVLALAVADQRSPLAPDIPAMSEVVPNYERSGSYGMLAPAGTPRPVLHQISNALRRVFEQPDVKARLLAMGFATAPTTPEEYDKIVRGDIETFGRMVRIAGLRK